MKYLITILILLPFLAFSQVTESEIDNFLTSWHKAASKANLKEYFDALDEEAIFIGTDTTEHWSKSEFYKFAKPYFGKGKAWSFKANSRNIFLSKNKNYAWFDELLHTSNGTWRGSGIIVKENDILKIKHYTLSVTLPNEKMADFFELLKK